MGKRKKTYYVKLRKGKRRNKVLKKRSTDINHVPKDKQYLESATSELKIGVVKKEQIEMTIESCDDDENDHDESRIEIDTPCETQEVWVVRRQLCRGCHSDGAFWSLQTTTEGDTYGDLLQTYFNIQLCPVSQNEHALSAICALCAARLREVRAFSAQARAAEERFSRFYKQNRVRALVNAVVIKKDVPKNDNVVDELVISDDDDDPDTVNSVIVDDLVISDYEVPDTVNSAIDNPEVSIEELAPKLNENKDIRVLCYNPASKKIDALVILDDEVPDTVNSAIDNPEVSTDELAPKLNKDKDAQVRCYKPASKKTPAKKLVTKEDTQKILNEDDPQPSKEKLTKVNCDKPAPKKIFHLSPSDYQRTGSSFKCTRCDKVFYKRARIHDHVRNVHTSPQFTCPHCDKTFKNIDAFNRHKKKYHSSINKKESKIVYKLSPSDFERIGKSYKCTHCEKQYQYYTGLRSHVMFKHLKLPRYRCSHCDKTFHTNTAFNKHKLQEHSIDDRIKCNACDWFTYDSISKLTKHMNVFHMLGKKLICPDCDFVSFSQFHLRRHRVKHSTVKKHHCNYCKKSFLRKSNLVFHERIHTGDKRKVCNECGQAFVQRASLTYHMAKHHPEVRF